jgi:hypothetical protein
VETSTEEEDTQAIPVIQGKAWYISQSSFNSTHSFPKSIQFYHNFPKSIQFYEFPKIHSILPILSQNQFNSTYSFSKFIQFYQQFPEINSILPSFQKIHSILPTEEVDSFLFTSTYVQFQFWCMWSYMNIAPSHLLGCHSGDVQHIDRKSVV